MKKVYLHGKLGKRFGRKWEIAAHTPAEIIKGLDANADGFFEYIQKKAIDGESYLLLSKPPKKIKNEEDAGNSLILHNDVNIKYKASEIHIVPLASGGAFITSALAVVGIAAGTFASTMIVAMVWGAIISVAMNLIFKPPKPPKRGTPTTTKSYLMRGANSRQAQGIAVPLGYGRLKIGAANVSVSTQVMKIDDSKSTHALESFSSSEYLDLLCEGPIEGFVNKNGGAISGGDIREGIYLNDVQVKNTPVKNSQEGTLNYILNDSEDSGDGKPLLKKGEAFDSTILSESINSIVNHDIMIIGSSPYDANRKGISYNQTVDAAVGNQAKIVSHFVSNRDVSSATFSLMSELSISNDDGGTAPNNVKFAILIVRNHKEYNVLSPESGCYVTQNKNQPIATSLDLEVSRDNLKRDMSYLNELFGAEFLAGSNEAVLNAGGMVRQLVHTNEVRNNQVAILEANFDTYSSLLVQKSDEGFPFFMLTGICSSSYQFNINVQYSAALNSSEISGGVTFKIVKLSPEYDPSVKDGLSGGLNKRRNLKLAHVKETILERMLYPNSAMVRITLDSKNFSQMPNRTYHAKLKKILIPKNYDPVSRKYVGPWNGLFKGQDDIAQSVNEVSDSSRYWSDNPAWVFFDLLSNPRYGIGKYGLEEDHIDKWQLYKLAKYCDELVETDYPVETSTGKPRAFSCKSRQRRSSSGFNILVEGNDPGFTSAKFAQEFGSGTSFAGKKVAFFIHQHSFSSQNSDGSMLELTSDQKLAIATNSINKVGDIVIEERTIIKSDATQKVVTLSGPNFADNSAVFRSSQGSTLIGGCATQINYAIVEPRFVANLYLTERSEALQIINSMASIFRGMIGYSAGKVSASFDSPKSPIQLFNNSNVIGGDFNYLGTQKNKKITASLVRFNNKDKNFKPDVVYEEDSSSMQSLGYIENETMGFGITSEGQARRLAKWSLLTSQLETESIKFSAGQEASYLLPGSVFEVCDEARVGSNKSGRVLDVQLYRDKVVLVQDGQFVTQDVSQYFDPYILIDKDNLSNPILGKVDISISRAQTNESLEGIQARSKFETSDEDQLVEIESLRSSQIVRFEGSISLDFDINNFGPQGQKTIVHDLKLKLSVQFSISDDLIKSYNHSLSDGDLVSFSSEGQLPGGLDVYSSDSGRYYVISSTKHTFQVSLFRDGQPVNIFNAGKDYFGNEGGFHYLIIFKESFVTDSLSQVGLGSPYSIKGLMSGTSGDKDVSKNFKESLSVSGNPAPNWFESDFLGTFHYSSPTWIYVSNLGWIYAAELTGRALGNSAGFWMYLGSEIDGIGWVWTNDDLKDTFWYISDSKKWVYVMYTNSKKTKISGLFVYDDDLSLIKGGKYILGKNRELFISMVASNGYFLIFDQIDDLSTYMVPLTSQPPAVSASLNNPSLQESSIINFVKIESQHSSQGKDGVVVELAGDHSVEFDLARSLEIFGVDTDNQFGSFINSKWQFIRLASNRVELVASSSAAALLSSAVFINQQKGTLSIVKIFRFEAELDLKSQLFRTVSVKEITENNYEVVGLEYNPSKFLAADSKGVTRSPSLPIPPQADMSIPDPPDGLLLFDLSV